MGHSVLEDGRLHPALKENTGEGTVVMPSDRAHDYLSSIVLGLSTRVRPSVVQNTD